MGWERCPRPEQIDDCPSNKSAKIPHPTTGLPDSRSATSRIRFAIGTRPKILFSLLTSIFVDGRH
jgi:hypothetical protein